MRKTLSSFRDDLFDALDYVGALVPLFGDFYESGTLIICDKLVLDLDSSSLFPGKLYVTHSEKFVVVIPYLLLDAQILLCEFLVNKNWDVLVGIFHDLSKWSLSLVYSPDFP